MAEEGVAETGQARRKAAQRLKLAAQGRHLPSHEEIVEALHDHLHLFCGQERKQLLHQAKAATLALMRRLSDTLNQLPAEE